jgi:hypothetical protein
MAYEDRLLAIVSPVQRCDSISEFRNLVAIAGEHGATYLDFAYCAIALRRLLYMIPDFSPEASYNVRRRTAEAYLLQSGITFDESDLEWVLEIGNALTANQEYLQKTGWGELHFSTRHELLEKQNWRCLVCGCTLSLGPDQDLSRKPEIDHALPFRIGGNSLKNLRVLCHACNNIKSDDLASFSTSAVCLNNFLKENRLGYLQRVTFWTFVRDNSACQRDSCKRTSHVAQLFMEKKSALGRYVFDNCRTVCEHCRKP